MQAIQDIWAILDSDSEREGAFSQLRESVESTFASIKSSIQDGSWLQKTDTVTVWHPEYNKHEWAGPGTQSHERQVRSRRA